MRLKKTNATGHLMLITPVNIDVYKTPIAGLGTYRRICFSNSVIDARTSDML
jgi:hypothetical protein